MDRLTANYVQLLLSKIAQLIGSLGSGAYAAATGTPVDGEVPSGVINGINMTFTLVNIPITGSVHLFLNGQRKTSGYTVVGNTITYTGGPTPQTGDGHVADYRY